MPARCLLYYITDRTAFPGDELTRQHRLLKKISEATRAGIDYIQVREKDLSSRDLETLAREAARVITHLRTENPDLRTALLINSRTDVALAVQADGVHLRSNDISPEEVRAVWRLRDKCGAGAPARANSPRGPVITVSSHSPAEVARAAASNATFAVFAPVFEKKGAHPAGLAALKQACQSNIPVLALGGITPENASSCLAAGAVGIAAIRLFQDNDITTVVQRLRFRG